MEGVGPAPGGVQRMLAEGRRLIMDIALPRRTSPAILFPFAVALTAFQLYYVWLGGFGPDYLHSIAYSTIERPYVYRALLPILSRSAEWLTGIPAVSWLIVFVVACGVGLYYALRYLARAFYPRRAELAAFAGTEVFFLLILVSPHPYDVATAFLFCLSFALLAHGKYTSYAVVFLLATLNRETTFLLILFFLIRYWRRMPILDYSVMLAFQIGAYAIIQGSLRYIFMDHPGTSADFQPFHNLGVYAGAPVSTLALLTLFAVTLYFVRRGWQGKPLYLRTAFVLLFPLQVLLHLTLGGAFEIRVYAEVFPVIWLLMLPLTQNRLFVL
jgi:hypothetical protein